MVDRLTKRGITVKKGEASRAKILKAAETLFMENGVPQTTVADITVRAGIAKGTFYHHFKSKESLVAAFASCWSRKHLEELRDIIGQTAVSYEKRFSNCLLRAVSLARQYDGLQRRAGIDDEEYDRYVDQFVLLSADVFEPFLKEGMDCGFLEISHPREVYLIFAFGMRALRRTMPDEVPPEEVRRLVCTAEEMFHIKKGALSEAVPV